MNDPLAIRCPRCGVLPREPCRKDDGSISPMHTARFDAAQPRTRVRQLEERIDMLEERVRALEDERRERVARDHASPYVCANQVTKR